MKIVVFLEIRVIELEKEILIEKGKEYISTSNQTSNSTLSKMDKPKLHNTQKEMAKEIGVSLGTLARMEQIDKHGSDELKRNINGRKSDY